MSILILSGPSGSGKSTLCSAILQEFKEVYFSISSTTREPRVGEQNGREYFFLSQEEFLQGIQEGNFLEWAKVHTNYYGTSLKPVEKALGEGKIVIFDVDVQGHRNLKKYYGRLAASVFVTTPNQQILAQRLRARNTDDEASIEVRLKHAYEEMQSMGEFDFVMINDDINRAKDSVLSIVKSLDCAQSPLRTQKILKEWLQD